MRVINNLHREASFLFRQKYLLAVFSIIFTLSAFAVWSGVKESQAQTELIQTLLEKDATDRESVLTKQSSYGAAAYYSFHLTYSEPSKMAFAAMGQRDIYPWKHRVRMLALEGQIYETDADNPELSFLGRFDFAFLVSVLLPLFIILLLHDLRSTEREAGRYDLLIATAKKQQSLWGSRASVLALTLALVLLTPFIVASVINQAPLALVIDMILVVIAHLVFWLWLTLFITSRKFTAKQSSAQTASVLLAIWLALTVLVPVTSDLAIDNTVDSPKGGDIVLTQREAVNDAWDLPVEDTWEAFLATHPQWQGKTDMGTSFEWKWYYAFQQVGDQKASELSNAYRRATIEKDQIASRLALLSPPMLTQRLMSNIANTDTAAAIEYEQSIRDYHKALRSFYYPLMFNKVVFSLEQMAEIPNFPDHATTKNDKD